MSIQLTDHMVYFQHALTTCQDAGDGADTEAIYTMPCTCSQSSEMYLDATDDLPVSDTPVSEQNDTLTFAVSPSSLPSTSVYYSLLRSSENNPTKGYYVTKRWLCDKHTDHMAVTERAAVTLARIQTRHSWSFLKKRRKKTDSSWHRLWKCKTEYVMTFWGNIGLPNNVVYICAVLYQKYKRGRNKTTKTRLWVN